MISTMTATVESLTSASITTYGLIAVLSLIVFLALKEIMRSQAAKNPRIQSFLRGLNIAIIPLLLIFVAIIAYKIMTLK